MMDRLPLCHCAVCDGRAETCTMRCDGRPVRSGPSGGCACAALVGAYLRGASPPKRKKIMGWNGMETGRSLLRRWRWNARLVQLHYAARLAKPRSSIVLLLVRERRTDLFVARLNCLDGNERPLNNNCAPTSGRLVVLGSHQVAV